MGLKRRRKQQEARMKTVQAVIAIAVVVVMGLAVLPLSNLSLNPAAGPTATISASSMPLPTVPPGGVPLIPKQTTFHSSGVLSIPQLVDWEPPAQSPEERILPTATTPFVRFALTFINSGAGSVIHAFAERDPDRKAGDKKVASVQDLDAYYDKKALDAPGTVLGGWKDWGARSRATIPRLILNLALKATPTGAARSAA
jgi:hypothetical protein